MANMQQPTPTVPINAQEKLLLSILFRAHHADELKQEEQKGFLEDVRMLVEFERLNQGQVKRQFLKYVLGTQLAEKHGEALRRATILMAELDSKFILNAILYILSDVLMIFEAITPENSSISLFSMPTDG